MQVASLFLLYCQKFEQLNIPYLVTGSVATILYGEPRLTNDIDIIVFLERFDVHTFISSFPIDEYYCPPEEVLVVESKRLQRGHFNLIHHESGYKADIYVAHRDPFFRWALDNGRRIALGGSSITLAPPEYVLVSKLSYYKEGGSEKHLSDLHGMITCDTVIDWRVVEDEIHKRGLMAELEKLKRLISKNNCNWSA